MKFWISGRIDYDIDNIFFGNVLHFVENSLNNNLKEKLYGDVESWDIIMVIYKDCDNNMEQFKYSSKDKTTDIEICIDYNSFKSGELANGILLFFSTFIYSFEKMRGHKKLKEFNFKNLIEDVEKIKIETTRSS